VVLPWGFKPPKLHLEEAFGYPGTFDAGLFKVTGMRSKDLWLGDEGFEAGTFEIDRLSLFKDVLVA
jgi:hypothetical protein